MGVKSSEDGLKKVLFDILAIDSTSGNEDKIIEYITDYVHAKGFDTLSHDGSLIVLKHNRSKRALHFNAHVDTVKADENSWTVTKPLQPIEKEGKIYGLGAGDDKASVVALLGTIEELAEEDTDCDFYFAFTRNEEKDGSGTESFMKFYKSQGLLEKYDLVGAVVLEPTGLKNLEYGNRGNAFVSIETKGKSCHASRPQDGENAVLKMVDVIAKLKSFEQEIKKYHHEDLGNPSIAIGTMINGGISVNKIPDFCKMTCDIRTIPGIHETLLQLLKSYVGDIAEVSLAEGSVPYSLTPKDSSLVKITQEVTGAELVISRSSNDAYFYTRIGIPAVVYGPGIMDLAHASDEYVVWKDVPKAINAYVAIAKKFSKLKEGAL